MSTQRSGGMKWRFDDPVYQQRYRSMKRSRYGSWGVFLYPEPRHFVIAMCFLATLTAYVERTGFSIAYTLMAKESDVDQGTKGAVMSAFYWGYGISQIPGGIAAQRFGGEGVLVVCFGLWSLASLVTPGNARSTVALMCARFIVGVSQGFLIPSVHTVLSIWIPAQERAKAVSLTTSGMYLGSAAAMELLPMVSKKYGAATILRLVGILGVLWLVMFRRVMRGVASSSSGLPVSTAANGGGSTRRRRASKTPWKNILSHPATWSIVINNFTFHYAFYIVMNWLPTYFDKVLHASIESVGFAKTLPYLGMFLTSNMGGWVGDYLISRHGLSVAGGRKCVNTGIMYTTSALAAAGFARGGFSVNHMDIAPKYAGAVMGISNTAGTLSGVIGVAVMGQILAWNNDGATPAGWFLGFSLAAALCILGSGVFTVYAKGTRLFGDDSDQH
eukprot:jgi/Picre1/30994/NNA_006352.t1